jgi:EAL domain-containing protein (putative c-di-GMP-specific phosphodiesterase class I)
MTRRKQILCIDPEPIELRIEALLNRRGILADLTESTTLESLSTALEQPDWWDLILCDARAFAEPGIADRLNALGAKLDASLVLLESQAGGLTPVAAHLRGAADLVQHGDVPHLLMVCERELQNSTMRKELRRLRKAARIGAPTHHPPLLLPTIHDLGRAARSERADARAAGLDIFESGGASLEGPSQEARIRSLVEAGGLALEFQPIISFRADEGHRGMFEALLRLEGENGHTLLPKEFLPTVARAGWMGKVDLWAFRHALATLEQMQQGGYPDAVLFVNIATPSLSVPELLNAFATFGLAAHISPGSLVIEVRKSAFDETLGGLLTLMTKLRAKHHGLLIEDVQLQDCALLKQFSELVTHLKLDRALAVDLAEGRATPKALADLVRCAKRQGMRVIAMAVESPDLLSVFFNAGIDAIQGHFVSLPRTDLAYPTVQQIEIDPTWP